VVTTCVITNILNDHIALIVRVKQPEIFFFLSLLEPEDEGIMFL
jgi:hypothetical protein